MSCPNGRAATFSHPSLEKMSQSGMCASVGEGLEKVPAKFFKRSFSGIAFLVFAALGLPAAADEFKVGDITIEQPWSRATPKGAKVAVGYLVIHNHGALADRLMGGSADLAGNIEIHEMWTANGVMKMRQVTGGLVIPAGGKVELRPGRAHLMFADVAKPLKMGETVAGRLIFERAGAVAVTFRIAGIGASSLDGADHNGGKGLMPMEMDMGK